MIAKLKARIADLERQNRALMDSAETADRRIRKASQSEQYAKRDMDAAIRGVQAACERRIAEMAAAHGEAMQERDEIIQHWRGQYRELQNGQGASND